LHTVGNQTIIPGGNGILFSKDYKIWKIILLPF